MSRDCSLASDLVKAVSTRCLSFLSKSVGSGKTNMFFQYDDEMYQQVYERIYAQGYNEKQLINFRRKQDAYLNLS